MGDPADRTGAGAETKSSDAPTMSWRGARSLGDRMVAGGLFVATACAGRVSLPRVLGFGAAVGRGWARLGLPRTRRVRAQLARALPETPEAELDRLTSGVFEHLGLGLAELVALRGRHRGALVDAIEVAGLGRLAAAEAASSTRGVLIVSAHLGNWELAGIRMAELGIAVSAVFRGFERRALDEGLLAIRRAGSPESAEYEQLRMGSAGLGLLRALRQGRKAIVLLDQNARRDEGLFVPFFGRPACVRTGPLQVALRAGVPILTAFARRDPATWVHEIEIEPALSIDRSAADGGLAAAAEQITARIEARIRRQPTQWIWTHRRWRTRPIDEAGAS